LVRAAMADIHLEARSRVYDGLVTSLKAAGVNIGQLLFVLGIPARTIDELTEPEIAKVIRYVRINDSRAMNALIPFLNDFLAVGARASRSSKISNTAA